MTRPSLTSSYVTSFLLFWIILPLMTLHWPRMTLIDLQPFRSGSIIIVKKLGMLHIKWKPIGQQYYKENMSKLACPHWPLITSKLSISEHMHHAYQKKTEHLRTSYVTNFFLFRPYDLINWPLITFYELSAKRKVSIIIAKTLIDLQPLRSVGILIAKTHSAYQMKA